MLDVIYVLGKVRSGTKIYLIKTLGRHVGTRGRNENGTRELYWKSHFDIGDILNTNVGKKRERERKTLKSNLGDFRPYMENLLKCFLLEKKGYFLFLTSQTFHCDYLPMFGLENL